MIRIGVLGCGKMGGAILRGLAQGRASYELFAASRSPERCAAPEVRVLENPAVLLASAEYIILALKPQQIPAFLTEYAASLGPEHVLISIAAWPDLETLRGLSQGRCPLVRVMPNTPARVGQGILGICLDDQTLSKENCEAVIGIFQHLGRVVQLSENRFNAFTALFGCGPGYVFYFMDALARAGVTLGYSEEESRELVLALLKGCVALAGDSADPFAAMCKAVCSPGGMTEQGIIHLDHSRARDHIIESVMEAFAQGERMSKG